MTVRTYYPSLLVVRIGLLEPSPVTINWRRRQHIFSSFQCSDSAAAAATAAVVADDCQAHMRHW